MAITTDPTTTIGQVRLYCQDNDSESYFFEDTEINVFITDASGIIKLAAYFALRAMISKLSSQPNSRDIDGYSEKYDINALQKSADSLKKDLEDLGIGLDGNDLAQYGFAEVGRDRHSWRQVENNKTARGETY